MSRRKSRIIAFQALYSWDVGKEPLEELLKFQWVEDKNEEEELTFSRLIIAGTIEHIDEIDDLIKKNLSPKWDFERLSRVTVSILRISIFSILYQKETHESIIIDEAIDIAKEFGPDDSYKFINAMLDNISKQKRC